jgi:Cell division protein CrgA
VPKSRVRSKTVYTPPARSAKAKVSPPWLLPAMLGSLVFGLVWIVVFYVSQQAYPIHAIGGWNLVVGFAFVVGGLGLATRWH